jgi:SOS-response transcriptional repressor LexA
MSTLTMNDILDKTKDNTREASLSSRLAYALERLRISQSELARRVGVKPQIIQYLCTGNATKSKFAYEIASALEINPDWLIAGKGPMLFSLPLETSLQPKVPLLTWHQIIDWLNNEAFKKTVDHFINITNIAPPSCFAVKVNDTSMIPRFEINTVLVIDPLLEAKSGDFVIAQTLYQDQPVMRQLMSKNRKLYLTPSNYAIYKEIELTTEDKILGIVTQTYYEFIR